MKFSAHILFLWMLVIFFSCKQDKKATDTNEIPEQTWEQLLDNDLSQWQPFLGIPHKSTGIEGYENVEDVTVGTPLGLGNQKKVFSVIQEEGETVLKVTGEIFGCLMSKKEYENFHLKLQVKWGDKRWEPRLDALHNNGLLYHSVGEPGGGLWNTWMSALEFEIENTNFGDLITINETRVKAKSPSVKIDGIYYYDPLAALQDFCWGEYESGRCYKTRDLEKPMGEWTSLELICYKDMALHIVEGEIVMAVYQPRYYDGSEWVPLNKGKLQIQSEGSEAYFKNVQIKSIDTLEKRYQKFVR